MLIWIVKLQYFNTINNNKNNNNTSTIYSLGRVTNGKKLKKYIKNGFVGRNIRSCIVLRNGQNWSPTFEIVPRFVLFISLVVIHPSLLTQFYEIDIYLTHQELIKGLHK